MRLSHNSVRRSHFRQKSFPCFLSECNFVIKVIEEEEEILSAYHVRHCIFCEELGWVRRKESMLEFDEHDNNAIFIGVFDSVNKLKAFCRLILPKYIFMIEKEFASLVDSRHSIKKSDDRGEISRLCVSPDARNHFILCNNETYSISMLLFKGVYHWCKRNHIRYLYAVVEAKMLKLLRAKGFPCKLIGSPQKMKDGTIAVAVIMDWREFEIINISKLPKMFKWFMSTENQLNESQVQLQ